MSDVHYDLVDVPPTFLFPGIGDEGATANTNRGVAKALSLRSGDRRRLADRHC